MFDPFLTHYVCLFKNSFNNSKNFERVFEGIMEFFPFRGLQNKLKLKRQTLNSGAELNLVSKFKSLLML